MSEPVRLRLVDERELSVVAGLWTDPQAEGDFEWRRFRPPQQLRRRFEEDGLLSDDGVLLAIEVAGELLWPGWCSQLRARWSGGWRCAGSGAGRAHNRRNPIQPGIGSCCATVRYCGCSRSTWSC